MFAALNCFLVLSYLPSSPQHPPHLSIFLPLWFPKTFTFSPRGSHCYLSCLYLLSMSVFFLNSQPSPFLCFSLIKKKCQTSLELSRSGGEGTSDRGEEMGPSLFEEAPKRH